MSTRQISDADGTWTEYLDGRGVVYCRTLTAESPAFTTAESPGRAAAAAAAADAATKRQAALATIVANVTRVTNNGAGSGTDANRDNWLMALTYLVSQLGG